MQDSQDIRKNLGKSVEASLKKAEETVSDLRKNHQRVLTTTIISSGAATMIAGLTATFGESAQIGTEGWRLACILAALFGFVSTVSTGMSQQFKYSDRLSEGKQCVGNLRSLNLVLTTGSKNWEVVVQEYEEIVKTYAEFV